MKNGFAHSKEEFTALVESALHAALKLGASASAASVSEGSGTSVSVRMGELENLERNRDKSLGVTVYLGQQRGNASTSDFSSRAIEETVRAAYDIARFTGSDDFAGLADADKLATPQEAARDLDLFHPWQPSNEDALKMALACEVAALSLDKRINNSEGASVSAQQSHFYSAQMLGQKIVFAGGYASSRHSISVAPIATDKNGDMQRDYWYSSMRAASQLAAPEVVGRYAAERALSRLGSRQVATCTCPVLFESPLAAGLLGSMVQAVSGGALYRKSSFLLNSLGKSIFPKHIDVLEDPYTLQGKGSSPFDDEGVRVQAATIVDAGKLQTYFLSSYSARKLGMQTTGHAGGSHNLTMQSRLTQPSDDLPAMIKKLHRGLFVTELMGQGVNYITGDYSRGAAGFWVENGEIAYPVHEITIAGNMKDMFKNIEAIGADAYNYGAKTVGSILVGSMKVAGS